MKNKFQIVLAVLLLAAPPVANAEQVEAGTSNILTFRDCVSGDTVCDDFGPMQQSTIGGVPGELVAEVSQADVAYGEAYGRAELTGDPGASTQKAIATSLPATRNGSSNVMLQRYTNAGESAETLTFGAVLTYEQTVPAENAGLPDKSRTRSGASAEMVIFTMDAEAIEAGATAEELYTALSFEQEPDGLKDLDSASVMPDNNETGEGTTTLSTTAIVARGDSVWLWAILQGIAVNGATVNASLETTFNRSAD